MADVSLEAFKTALERPRKGLSLGRKLKIPDGPKPFGAPTLRVLEADSVNPLEAEVIFIKSHAAVCKSAIATHIADALKIPLRDTTPVPLLTRALKRLV